MSTPRSKNCRICRRAGAKVYLKGIRCHTAKCPFERSERAPRAPGMHRWRRGKPSEYAIRLREKQKLKAFYGLREKQFRRFYSIAEKQTGNTGENLLVLLERRLDNVLTVSGFAASRAHARELIVHGHVTVNGRKLSKPSALVKADDVITPRPKDKVQEAFKTAFAENEHKPAQPAWISVKEDPPELHILRLPGRDEVSVEIQEQLVVESTSR